MFRFLLSRLAVIIPTFFGITVISFLFPRLLRGDPVLLLSGERGVSPERHAELMHQFGFDRSWIVQYFDYIWRILHGDFGTSISTKSPVLHDFFSLFPATVELTIFAITFAILLGIPAGVIAAVKRGSIFDQAAMGIALIGYSMPIFWWGFLLVVLFSNMFGLPIDGRINVRYFFDDVTGFMTIDSLLSGQRGAFSDVIRHLILPTIVLGTIPLAVIARQTRSAMLEVLSEDYMRTARAKGLPPRRVIGIHALRNALIPVVTTIGLQTGMLLAGALLTEYVFSWPGIGRWMLDSLFARDYPAVQGGLIIIAFIVMFVNLFVDLLYALINPAIRHHA